MSATGRASHEMGACTSKVYSDRLFFKALVIMIVRHLHTVHELLSQVMKKYSPQKIIGKSNTNFFLDNKILLAIAAATILTLLLPIFIDSSSLQVYNTRHAAAAGSTLPTDGEGLYESCNPSNTSANCLARLDQMSAGGFKLVLNYDQMYADAASEIAYLDRAQADGMKVIFEMGDAVFWNGTNLLTYFPKLAATCTRHDGTTCQNNTDFITYVINLVKNHSALWGYYIADEPGTKDHANVKTYSDLIHQLDANHPRLLVNNQAFSTFADTTDVIAGDDYPIGYGGTVDDVGTMASQVQSAATQYGIGSGMALQAVSWQEYYPPKHCNPYPSCAPFPTLDQMETMLNLALANSTPRLILWYSYFDTIDWDTKNNTTQYWNDVVTAANSIYSSSTDTIPPTVSISSPLNGAIIKRGSKVTISATASDNVGVTKVSFYVNNSLLSTDTMSPYSSTWNVPKKPHVTYTLSAKAYDAAGNTAVSSIKVTSG